MRILMDNGPIWPKKFLQKVTYYVKTYLTFFFNRLNIYATMKLHKHYTILKKSKPYIKQNSTNYHLNILHVHSYQNKCSVSFRE